MNWKTFFAYDPADSPEIRQEKYIAFLTVMAAFIINGIWVIIHFSLVTISLCRSKKKIFRSSPDRGK